MRKSLSIYYRIYHRFCDPGSITSKRMKISNSLLCDFSRGISQIDNKESQNRGPETKNYH